MTAITTAPALLADEVAEIETRHNARECELRAARAQVYPQLLTAVTSHVLTAPAERA